jgi:hypothetical protein
MDLGEKGLGDVDWSCLARIRYRWKDFVNAALTFVSDNFLGNCLVAAQLVDTRVVVSSIELVS